MNTDETDWRVQCARAEAALAHRDLAAAARHVDAAVRLASEPLPLRIWFLQGELHEAGGRLAEAEAAFRAAEAAWPDSARPPLRLAGLAWRRRDRETAWHALERAEARDSEDLAHLAVLKAEMLEAEGAPERAEAVLRATATRHPDLLLPHLRLAQFLLRTSQAGAALAPAGRAVALDPDLTLPATHLAQADALMHTGRTEQAATLLTGLLRRWPGRADIAMRLANCHRAHGDEEAIEEVLLAALAHSPAHVDLTLRLAMLLRNTGRTGAAVERLETLAERHAGTPHVALALAQACRADGQGARAQAILSQLAARDPLDPGLLRDLFWHALDGCGPDRLDHICALLRGRIPKPLSTELETRVFEGTGRYDLALEWLRRIEPDGRSAHGALRIGRALSGLIRPRLALRYLRLARRRWPADEGLLHQFMRTALKLGQYAQADAQLAAAAATMPVHVIAGHRFTVAGYRGDLATAVEHFAALREHGHMLPAHLDSLVTLIFTSLDPRDAPALFERIGHPLDLTGGHHYRTGLYGQQIMEFDLECAAFGAAGGYGSAHDWAQARPQSTVAAIRFVNTLRTGLAPADESSGQGPEIPLDIHQYWNGAHPPEEVRNMMASWARAPGATHHLFSRKHALTWLREQMGPEWATAFRLARNPAQEADLLRLCLLWHRGGIYADADDVLRGSLERVLGARRGLVLYREPLGGILANNFIAAAPGHPALLRAAQEARDALLQRSNETIWSATGPGLLTRAVAQYALAEPDAARRDLTILDWPDISRDILMHNTAHYKSGASHWSGTPRADRSDVWSSLQTALEAEP